MQLQILPVALQFCLVVAIWSLCVRDWHLAFINFVVVVVGFRLLHYLRDGRAPSLVLALLQRLLRGKASWASGLFRASTSATPRTGQAAARHGSLRSAATVAGRVLGRAGTGSTKPESPLTKLAAAFLAAQAEKKSRLPEQNQGLRQRGRDSTFTPSLQKPAEAFSKAASASSALGTAPPARAAMAGASGGPRKRDLHAVLSAGLGLESPALLAEAEMAARQAEMELFELLEAEASAKPSRSGRQREAAAVAGPITVATSAATASSPVEPLVAAVPHVDPHVVAPAAALAQKCSPVSQKVEHGAAANGEGQPQGQSAPKASASKKKVAPVRTVTRKEKEAQRLRQTYATNAAKVAVAAAPDKATVTQMTCPSADKDGSLAATLDAVAKSNALNGKADSICSATTTCGSSSPSPVTSPSSYIGTETDAEPQRSSGSGGASGQGDSESVEMGDGWSMLSSADTGDAADAREGPDLVDGDWARRVEPAYDCRGPCTLDDYFSYAYGSKHAIAEEAAQFLTAPKLDGQVLFSLPPVPPPPTLPPSELLPHSKDGIGLAEEIRAMFPTAKIHLGPPPVGDSPRGQPPPPPAAPPVLPSNIACADALDPALLPYAVQLAGLSAGLGSSIGAFAGGASLPPFHPTANAPVGPLCGHRLGGEALSVSAEMLFNSPAGSLGPPPAGALSVSQVEASSKAFSWRDRLRRNGEQHLGEVEAALQRRVIPHSGVPVEPTSMLPSIGTLSLEMHVPPSSGRIWSGDPAAIFARGGPQPESQQMGLQMPASSGQGWPSDGGAFPACGPVGGAPPAGTAEMENPQMAWQQAMPMMDYGIGATAEQMAAQLRAAAPCHYED